MLKTDVVIVTARGRHDWICEELARMGLNAVVLDMTEALGPWAPEDWEGPFGVFNSERILESQINTLSYEADIIECTEGFTLWTQGGPLETRGTLSSYQHLQADLDPVVRDYIAACENTYRQTRVEEERTYLLKQDYKKTWLAHMAHSLASPQEQFYPESMSHGYGLPLYSRYAVRRPQRRSQVQSRKRLEDLGHFYHQVRKITAVGANQKTLQSIECEIASTESASTKIQKFEANYFICTLSRLEVEYLAKQSQQWAEGLFVHPSEEPLWTWSRYRFHFKPHRIFENMPRSLFVVNDLYLSWTHENFLGLTKSDNTSDAIWDVWVKLAYHRRADKSYLQSLGTLAELQLKKRIAGLEVSHIEYPQYFHYEELAPLPFVVYGDKSLSKVRRVRHLNFYFAGVESQDQMDWTGFFERQDQVLRDIITDVLKERDKTEPKEKKEQEELR